MSTGIPRFRSARTPPSPHMPEQDSAARTPDEPALKRAPVTAPTPRPPVRRFAPHKDARFGIATTVIAWCAGVSLTVLVVDYPETLLSVPSTQVRLILATAN